MAPSELGITKADFEDFAFEDWARSVVRTPITKTISNTTGSPVYSQGTNITIKGIFTKKNKRYDFKEGLVELGDAFLQVKQDTIIEKEDLITVDSETYRVDEVLLRTPGGTRFFKSCVLFKV